MVAVQNVVVQETHAAKKRWMCRGFPQAVHNVVVQGHVGGDSSPLGSKERWMCRGFPQCTENFPDQARGVNESRPSQTNSSTNNNKNSSGTQNKKRKEKINVQNYFPAFQSGSCRPSSNVVVQETRAERKVDV